MVKPRFYNRTSSWLQVIPNGIEWNTRRFSWRAMGGPHRATMTGVGGDAFLAGVLDFLRVPVELYDELGELVWWGYVHEVKLRKGLIEIGVSLDRMANRIKVRYTKLTVGEDATETAVTAFGENSNSSGVYGRKELVYDAGDLILDEAGAEQLRDTRLNDVALPIPLAEFAASAPEVTTIEMECRGWWETLTWQLYSQGVGRYNYLDTKGGRIQPIGQAAYTTGTTITWEEQGANHWMYDTAAAMLRYSAGQIVVVSSSNNNDGTYTIAEVFPTGQRLAFVEDVDDDFTLESVVITPQGISAAQSFTTVAGDTWQVLTVAVRAKKIGSPSDNLRISIASDSGGSPNAVLVSGTIAAADIDDVVRWREATMSTAYSLAASTTYWVLVERTGSNDADDCYHVEVSVSAGHSGTHKYWNGSSWITVAGADMPFDVIGGFATSTMIQNALDGAQFINDVSVTNASGITTPLYQIEDQTIKQAVETWLQIGTTNNRRLLATVDKGRNVRIYEEPAPTTKNYRKKIDGSLTTEGGVRIPPQWFRAGVWLTSEEIETALPAGSRLAEAGRAFIEESEWTSDGKLRLLTKGAKPVWEL